MDMTLELYLVAVGLNEPPNIRGRKLKKAEDDARHFVDRMLDRFPRAIVRLLLGFRATSENIRQALDEITECVKDRPPGGYIVIFYFSGHGALIGTYKNGTVEYTSCLVTSDAREQHYLRKKNKALTGVLTVGPKDDPGSLLCCLRKIEGNKIAILDTCNGCVGQLSKAEIRKKGLKEKGFCVGAKPINLEPFCTQGDVPDNCWIVCASERGQYAFEDYGGGVFTNAFLESETRITRSQADSEQLQWSSEEGLSLEWVDNVDLSSIVESSGHRIAALGIPYQRPHLLNPKSKGISLPRLLGLPRIMEHGTEGIDVGPVVPPVPKKRIHRAQQVEIEEFLKLGSGLRPPVRIVTGPPASGKTTVVAAACKQRCYWRNGPSREDKPIDSRPLAWISLERDLSINYILPFISYHMSTSLESEVRRYEVLSAEKEHTLDTEQTFKSVCDMVNLAGGVIVFDNIQVLSDKGLPPEQLELRKRQKDPIIRLLVCLLENLKKGRLILICNYVSDLPQPISAVRTLTEEQYIVLSFFDTGQAAHKCLENLIGQTPSLLKLVGPNFDPRSLIHAAYLARNGCKGSFGYNDIWESICGRIEEYGLKDYAVFLSLFHGTNTEQFLAVTFDESGDPQPFRDLADMGILAREGPLYRIHPFVAGLIKQRWGDIYRASGEKWHRRAAQEYGDIAKKAFHLCQVREARRHYNHVKDHSNFAVLLRSPSIWSQLRNWGYYQYAKECLMELLDNLKPEKGEYNQKRDWFLSVLSLLELDRHELYFKNFDALHSEIEQYKESMPNGCKTLYYRKIGEMHLARREYEKANELFRNAIDACHEMTSDERISEDLDSYVNTVIEVFRSELRCSEIAIYRSQLEDALKNLDLLSSNIKSTFKECFEKLPHWRRRLNDSLIDNFCHQLAVAAALKARALLEIERFDLAQNEAGQSIRYSLFCRAYGTGDILGRVIGHAYLGMALASQQEQLLDNDLDIARLHITKANFLLERRILKEAWWYTVVCIASAFAFCKQKEYDKALEECINGLERLNQRLIKEPSLLRQLDQSYFSYTSANELLDRKTPNDEELEYDLLAPYRMSAAMFDKQFAFETNQLTDPWREAELLWTTAHVLNERVRNRDTGNKQILNAAKFSAYLGFALARKKNHTILIARLLRETARIFEQDRSNPKALKMSIELMWASCEITEISICSIEILEKRAIEFADMIDKYYASPVIHSYLEGAQTLLYHVKEQLANRQKDDKNVQNRIDKLKIAIYEIKTKRKELSEEEAAKDSLPNEVEDQKEN